MTQTRIRHWSLILLFFSIGFVLFTTLYPFDFFASPNSTIFHLTKSFDFNFAENYALNDFPKNMLLFIPLGFAMGGILANVPVRFGMLLTLGTGFLISLSIEVIQSHFLLRFPAVADVFANTIGALLGYFLFRWIGINILTISFNLKNSVSKLSSRTLLLFYFLYLGIFLFIAIQIQQTSQLSNWNKQYPLIIGNELTGDRPWDGFISNLFISNEILSQEQIKRFFDSRSNFSIEGSTVAQYNFTNDTYSNSMEWVNNSTIYNQYDDGAHFSENQWLVSTDSVSNLSEGIMKSSQLTLGLLLKSNDLNQTGPARIISISEDSYNRNLTVGQTDNNLVFRVRTSFTGNNGRTPEFVVSDVFSTNEFQRILITYDGQSLNFYIDEFENQYTLELHPAVLMLSYLSPTKLDKIRLNTNSTYFFARLLFSAVIIIPFVGILITFIFERSYSTKNKILQIIVGTILFLILLECVFLIFFINYRVESYYLLMNCILAFASMFLFLLPQIKHNQTILVSSQNESEKMQ